MAEDRPTSTVNSEYATPRVSVMALDSVPLEPPRASFFSPGPSIGDNSSRDSRALSATGPEGDKEGSTPAHSTSFLPTTKDSEGVEAPSSQYAQRSVPFYRRPVWLAIALAALVALILAIILPVYFTVIKKNGGSNKLSNGSGSGSGTSTSGAPNPTSTPINTGATTGGDGSTVFSGNTSFTYRNAFGGYWVDDPNDPFNNGARPNSWTKPLNQSWDWATDRVFGVNVGGLFVLEPFISPALFQKYPSTVDEWTLSVAMAADTGPGGGLQAQLEAHYDTFITEQDIAEMAGAGLNWIRLPIPFWAIETWTGEPFLAKVSWKYILRMFGWARKYGIRINLDLHTVPGSQNAYNHSGRFGQVNFLNGIMGIANAQRTLDYIRIIAEFISQPEYQDLIPLFSIINEALLSTIGKNELTSFYLHAHDMIRGITGYGAGHGPFIVIHDGFAGLANWAGFLQNSDRIALDVHPYLAFNGASHSAPIIAVAGSQPGGTWATQACGWGSDVNTSQTAFGVSFSGEFSSGYNPCGLFLLGTDNTDTTTGDCALFTDASTWNETLKEGLLAFTEGSMDALQNWWFWTWKVGNSTAGKVESPLWSYKYGLANGWVPKDPRTASGRCQALGAAAQDPWAGTYSAWQTGGAGAGPMPAASSSSFPWPPVTISGLGGAAYSAVPTYTPTGSISTLPPPQLTPQVSEGNGWYDAKDTASAMVTVSGCTYPNAWDSAGAVAPTAPCPAGAPPLVTGVPAVASAASAASTTTAAAVAATTATDATTTATTAA